MKSDARTVLNKMKWKNNSKNVQKETWRNRGPVDARKILNSKRNKIAKPILAGSYMRSKTATDLIASRIRKEIAPTSKAPDKNIQLSKDGNIIITSKSKKSSQLVGRVPLPNMNVSASSRNTNLGHNLFVPSLTSNSDDLEHIVVDDILDFESLPPALTATKSVHNLSRTTSALSQVLDKKHTMVADQLPQGSSLSAAKVYVSNLHPSVSRQDVMELFGNVGLIKGVAMMTPGTSVVDFYDEADAVKACDLYHNRLLDDLPMRCYLQSGSQQQKSTISQRLGERIASYNSQSTSTTVYPNLSSVSTSSRSRYNPRNVQFTVKLT